MKELKAGSQRDSSTPMFIATLFIIAKRWKQPKYPSMDEWATMWMNVASPYNGINLNDMGFPGGINGIESTCQSTRHKRCRFDHWVQKIPWRKKWQPTPVFLPGKFHSQRTLAGYTVHGVEKNRTLLST